MRSEPKPYKNPYQESRGNMPKPRKLKAAKKSEMGIMGSTMEQRIESQKKMLADMRKRMMLRKKKGQ